MNGDLPLQKSGESAEAEPPSKHASGQSFWRSLDELSGSKDFKKLLHREFPAGASELRNFNRRNFLKVIGASAALASLPACTKQPMEPIVRPLS